MKSNSIHQTAIISDKAKIGDNVTIKDDVEIMSHVCIDGYTTIGCNTKIFSFAAIGYRPQDLKYNGEKSRLIIGENNSIREYVTMHPGTESGVMETCVGNGNLFMVGVHIAHDCVIGNNIVMGNNVTLGGHVRVEDDVIIGGLSAVHQWARIGHGAIIGGMSGVERDVIPYGNVMGDRAHLCGLNIVGLRRANVGKGEVDALKKAYEIIFSKENVLINNLKIAENMFRNSQYVTEVISFMRQKSDRSYCQPNHLENRKTAQQ